MANVMTKSNVNYSSVTNLKSHSDLDNYIKQLYDGKPKRVANKVVNKVANK